MKKNILKQVSTFFALAVVLKIGLSIAGLKLNDPLWLGCVYPLTVMAGYWFLGFQVRKRWDRNLTKAKFADSVYYLGFLFTVTSIIICLIDIARISDNLDSMAIRFGAAMVSTALGMLARVLHTGFQVDADDAIQNMEERLIESSEKLSLAFDNAHHDLEIFRDKVTVASQEAVLGVQEQIESLYVQCISKMDAYFLAATMNSNDAFSLILEDAKNASVDMLAIISNMSDKSASVMTKMESNAVEFGDKVRVRLENTLFPEDIFTRKLNPSIDILSVKTDDVNQGIITLVDDVKNASRQVGTAIRGINTKAGQLESNIASINDVMENQKLIVDSLRGQNQLVIERVECLQQNFLKALHDYNLKSQENITLTHEVIEGLIEKLNATSERFLNSSNAENIINGLSVVLKNERENVLKEQVDLKEVLSEALSPFVKIVAENQLAVINLEKNHNSSNSIQTASIT